MKQPLTNRQRNVLQAVRAAYAAWPQPLTQARIARLAGMPEASTAPWLTADLRVLALHDLVLSSPHNRGLTTYVPVPRGDA